MDPCAVHHNQDSFGESEATLGETEPRLGLLASVELGSLAAT